MRFLHLITVSWKVELGRGSYTANPVALSWRHTLLVDSRGGSSQIGVFIGFNLSTLF